MTTLDEVIRAHGGEARSARDRYVAASEEERSAIIAFLRTLVILPCRCWLERLPSWQLELG